jgi:hypothetical protein
MLSSWLSGSRLFEGVAVPQPSEKNLHFSACPWRWRHYDLAERRITTKHRMSQATWIINSHLIALLSQYLPIWNLPHFKHSSFRATSPSNPCRYQSVSRSVIHRATTVYIARSSLGFWLPVFCSSAGNIKNKRAVPGQSCMPIPSFLNYEPSYANFSI